MSDRLLTEAEAAERIGWSPPNLRARRAQLDQGAKDAAPPYVRIGRSVRYDPDDVRKWAKRHPEIVNADRIRSETISQDEVCSRLGISRSTLRERRSRLRLDPKSDAAPPHVYAGQEVRYRPADVDAWISRQRV